jgi:phosphoglycerate dehydrogenase-like enzyme
MEERILKVVQVRVPAQSPVVGGVESAVTVLAEWHYLALDDVSGIRAALESADVFVSPVLTKEMIGDAPGLRLISTVGAGYDKIDPAEVPAGCAVVNCYEHGPAIAEYVFSTVACFQRQLFVAADLLRHNDWSMWLRNAPLAPGLDGKTLGIVGFGHLGEHLARVGKALGMRAIAVTRSPGRGGAERRTHLDRLEGMGDLRRLLEESDVVVLCVPLSPETDGLIGEREIAWMKREAILVNPARGPVVDQHALFDALQHKRIAGAVLDVWWHYPDGTNASPAPVDVPFGELSNVVMTPHIAAATVETFRRRAAVIAENIDRFARGQPLINRVHLQPREE